MSRESKILTAVVAVAVAGLIALFMWGNRGTPSGSAVPNAQKLVQASSHKTGNGSVTVVEFGDYQCPACEAAYPTTKQMLTDYAGKITFVFRNYPLSQHKNAKVAAEAAEAAAAQGKFWEMHDKLYDVQNAWANLPDPTDTFASYAAELGLNAAKLKSDIQSNAYDSVIQADQNDGNDVSVQGTPTFFVNGVMAADYNYATLKTLIDAQLAK
jgi:protein-disulfide isomerase